jgi:hypothetical protein
MTSAEARKMDILLNLRKKGYNLKDTEDPAVLSMDLGNGYTLLASVKREWLIFYDDGVRPYISQIDSVKVPYTNSKDAIRLYDEFKAEYEARSKDELDEPDELNIESFEEPDLSGFEENVGIQIDDKELIKQIDAVMRSTKNDKTYGVVHE